MLKRIDMPDWVLSAQKQAKSAIKETDRVIDQEQAKGSLEYFLTKITAQKRMAIEIERLY